MYLSSFDEYLNYRLVAFYSAFSCVYFLTLLSALYFTNYLYSVGRYSFYPVIGVVLVAEYTKFLLGTFHFSRKQGGKYEGIITTSAKRSSIKSRIKEIMKCVFIASVMLFVYFFLAILFGAPVFSKHEETFMLSAILCALTIFPACLNLGASSVVGLLFGTKVTGDVLGESLLRCFQFTLFGTWLGAFVIPLDWDRPWQVWPIPCATGSMIGYTVGNFVMLTSLLPKLFKTFCYKSVKKN